MDFTLSKVCCQFLPTCAILFNKPVSYEASPKQDLKATPGPNTRTTQNFVSESPNAINCWMMLSMTMDPKQVSRK